MVPIAVDTALGIDANILTFVMAAVIGAATVKGPILVPLESGKIMAVLGQIDKAVDCPKIHAAGLHCILLTNLL